MKSVKAFFRQPLVIFLLILALGIFLRTYHFPSIPPGINQDEAGAGYEAFSLLTDGKDKWGMAYPMYFLSWGSGQNVLESYLQIPFIKIFGLTMFAIRFVPMLLGVLSIPLMFLTMKRLYTTRTALLAAFVVAVSPWGVVASRWSLESNLLPFFLLLGMCLLSFALYSPKRKWFIPFTLLPFALACYAYAIGFFIFPIIFLLVILSYYKKIRRDPLLWLIACVPFFLVIVPFLFFIYENNVIKQDLYSHLNLPITITYFKVTRLTQILSDRSTVNHSVFLDNIRFVIANFSDNLNWNMVPGFAPLFLLIPVFAVIKFFNTLKVGLKKMRLDLFSIWLIACIPLLFIFTLNINRVNAVFFPLIALFATGTFSYMRAIQEKSIEKIFLCGVVVALSWYSFSFAQAYFTTYPASLTKDFNVGYDKALPVAVKAAHGTTPIFITGQINLNYIVTLFYLKTNPEDFRTHSIYHLNREFALVERYRNIYFQDGFIKSHIANQYIYVLTASEKNPCLHQTTLYTSARWVVGKCDLTR